MPKKPGFFGGRYAIRTHDLRLRRPIGLPGFRQWFRQLRHARSRAVTVAVTALALCAGCVATAEPTPRLPVPVADVHPSVVQLVKGVSACSGVALDGHHVLTAAHCGHGDGAFVWARGDAGSFERHEVAGVSRTFHGQDLLELEVTPPLANWIWESSEPVREGDPLQLWGFGCDPSAGANTGPEVRAAIALSEHSAAATMCHGDSGGPVIGYDGVAGVMTRFRAGYVEFEPLL